MSAGKDSEATILRNRLRAMREYLGLSQQFVADQAGLLRSALADIERGVRKVDALELRRLARVYRHPIEYFLSEDEPFAAAPNGEESVDERDTIVALNRAAGELTQKDREEVLRFAEFLRHYGQSDQRKKGPSR